MSMATLLIYRADRLPKALDNTRPYYFDGPERFVKEKVLFGFGPYGFETRVEGPTTEKFVAELQRRIKEEVEKFLLEKSSTQ